MTPEIERLTLRREATELILRARGPQDQIGPAAMAAQFDPMFRRLPHTNVMNAALADLLIRPGGGVMIWTPPRAGKSALASQWFPDWWLTQHPTQRVVLAAYGERLPTRHAVAARDIMAAYGPEYGLALSRTQAEKMSWSLTTGGGMIARGVGSGLTGEDMDLGIIDDPVKDRAAAESETIREGVWDWYSGAFVSRLVPHTRAVVIMTRWRHDDLAGRILDSEGRVEEGGRWVVVHLPAIALSENLAQGIFADPLGREPGEPLPHPKIEPGDRAAMLAHWNEQRARSTARDWNALYQGVPHDAEGALVSESDIRRVTRPTLPTDVRRRAVAVDPSGSGGRDTAGVVGLMLDGDGLVWFTEDRTRRMSSDQWSREACMLADEMDAGEIIVEKNFGGDQATTLIAMMWRQLQNEGVIPRNSLCPMIRDVTAKVSKVLRAEPIAMAIKTDRIRFLRGLTNLSNEWQMWTPGSTWSPGALDASVHGATFLLPTLPRGAQLTDPSKVSLAGVEAAGLSAVRISR